MKIYKSNRKANKWYEKINWLRLVLLLLSFFAFSFAILSILAQMKDIENALKVSILISLLVGIESVLIDILEHRDRIYFINKNKITYIEIHDDKDGKIYTHLTYYKMLNGKDLEEVHNNIDKYEGIDKGEIIEVKSIKKKCNRTIVKAKVKAQEWDVVGKFTISKMTLNEVEKEKTFIIMNDYEGYSELIEKIEKLMI